MGQNNNTRISSAEKTLPVSHSREVYRIDRSEGIEEWTHDRTAGEYPLTIYVNDREMATLVCSPTHLENLVRGFLTAEGVIRREENITRFFINHESETAHVEAPDRDDSLGQEMFAKRYVGSCCGKSRTGFYFANDARTAREVTSSICIDTDSCFELIDRLRESSPLFKKTGGVHNAGLVTLDSKSVIRTDIGRHNTLDKLYGHALSENIPLEEKIIIFSGRISSEIILKVSKMGCPILISRCAPTELALNMAEDLGITAIGFVRAGRMNIYTHPERIKDVPEKTSVNRS